MLLNKITLAVLIVFSLYSVETNASTISANQCTLGLLPFGTTMLEDTKKEEIIKAYEKKGFQVTVLSHQSEVKDVEFISDATVDCSSGYFGQTARTTVRLVETESNKIVSRAAAPAHLDLFKCVIKLFDAIELLPTCQIK